MRCSLDVNECAANPCEAKRRCVDKHDGYDCVCHFGYYGHDCEKGRLTITDQLSRLTSMIHCNATLIIS